VLLVSHSNGFISVSTPKSNTLQATSPVETAHPVDVAALQEQILRIVQNRDGDSLRDKQRLLQDELLPLFDQIATVTPLPKPVDQVSAILGPWRSVWSTIPFQDLIPGRGESYQLFYDSVYVNAAA